MLHWRQEPGFTAELHEEKWPLAAAMGGKDNSSPPIFRIAIPGGFPATVFGMDLSCFQRFELS
jgi:hypothetical protein